MQALRGALPAIVMAAAMLGGCFTGGPSDADDYSAGCTAYWEENATASASLPYAEAVERAPGMMANLSEAGRSGIRVAVGDCTHATHPEWRAMVEGNCPPWSNKTLRQNDCPIEIPDAPWGSGVVVVSVITDA